MLKSTHKPSANLAGPLPPGWTEHKAPTGHTYYYNAATKESTYKRPTVAPPAALPGAVPGTIPGVFQPQAYPQAIPNLSDPAVANAYLAMHRPQEPRPFRSQRQQQGESRPKPQPRDKPRSREAIPGCEPWVLVHTKYGRRFVYNSEKKASYWRIPERLMPAILELDRARVAKKAGVILGRDTKADATAETDKTKDTTKATTPPTTAAPSAGATTDAHNAEHDDSSDYEEVEVTDDEYDEPDVHRAKRQRTEDGDDTMGEAEQDMDMDEEMALQLQLMAQEQGLEQDYEGEGADDNDEMPEFTEEDARELFKDLLNDYKISPFSPWETLLEEAKVMDDPRYTALPTTRARKEVWEGWSREKIREIRELKAKEEKPDPRVVYMAFLEKNASTKLYWPEFKRKFRKEACMRDFELEDKDRERWYREYVNKLKMPQAAVKAELTALLRSLPLSVLNSGCDVRAGRLPKEVAGDVRFIALPRDVRTELVEAYTQSLGPAPGADGSGAGEGEGPGGKEEAEKARDARLRRERALEERNRAVEAQKEREGREKGIARERLRQGEMEIERAMQAGRRGR